MVGDINIKNASNWILENKITIDGTEISIKLSAQQKYIIVKKYWASTEFSQDDKMKLKDKVFESDDSDLGKNVQKVLDWILPDADLKAKLWAEINNAESTDSIMDTQLKI